MTTPNFYVLTKDLEQIVAVGPVTGVDDAKLAEYPEHHLLMSPYLAERFLRAAHEFQHETDDTYIGFGKEFVFVKLGEFTSREKAMQHVLAHLDELDMVDHDDLVVSVKAMRRWLVEGLGTESKTVH